MTGLVDSALIRPLRRKFIILRAHKHSNAVALTFDDGPNRTCTSDLLALLREEDAIATFFLVGSCIAKRPQLVQEIATDGHEIGIHSFTHSRMATKGFRSYAKEIDETAKLIEKYTQRAPRLFRPPFGEHDLRLLWLMMVRRIRCILWSVDHHDYLINDKDTLVGLIKNTPLVSGDILLFHDYKRTTIEAMPEIIRDIRSRGFSLVTVSQLLEKPVEKRKHPPIRMFPAREKETSESPEPVTVAPEMDSSKLSQGSTEARLCLRIDFPAEIDGFCASAYEIAAVPPCGIRTNFRRQRPKDAISAEKAFSGRKLIG